MKVIQTYITTRTHIYIHLRQAVMKTLPSIFFKMHRLKYQKLNDPETVCTTLKFCSTMYIDKLYSIIHRHDIELLS